MIISSLPGGQKSANFIRNWHCGGWALATPRPPRALRALVARPWRPARPVLAAVLAVLWLAGDFAWAADVSCSTSVSLSRKVYKRATKTYDVTATVKNTSSVEMGEPILLEVTTLSQPSVTLANSLGLDGNGHPYVKLPGSLIAGGQASVVLKFSNPERARFNFTTTVVGGCPSVIAAPITLPSVGPAPNFAVTWPVPVLQSTLNLEVRPFALLPPADNGLPPRLNAMAHTNGRLFVLDEKDGKIFEITGGVVSLWFNVRSAVLAATGRQMYPPPGTASPPDTVHTGLRSLAFHPDFATNGKFYTSLLEERPASPAGHRYLSDVSTPQVADSVLVEWTATNPGTTMNVASGSYREVFRVGIATLDHPIKQITFRPGAAAASADYGLLYVAHGDGSVQSTNTGSGMNKDALGKILRVNPLQNVTDPYSVPPSNPFVGDNTMIPEAYSIGHRNPHHPAFTKDGTLLVTEDGRDNIDEVNLVKAGANYGWPVREGTFVQLAGGTLVGGIAVLPANDSSFSYTYPAMQFLHTGTAYQGFTGQALGGGFAVENGSALSGKYLAIDFVVTGNVYFGHLDALKAATTKAAPASLTQAPLWQAKVLFDHDNNPSTPALAKNSLGEVTRMGAYYLYTPSSGDPLTPCTPHPVKCRADMRYGQGPNGEIYLMSKLNRQVYLVTNSLP